MTKYKIFNVLAIFMIGFGILIGVVFPFFVLLVTDVQAHTVLNPLFFTLCILAGIIVGVFNIFLAKKIVGAKLNVLGEHVTKVEKKLLNRNNHEGLTNYLTSECMIGVRANDEIGAVASAFNSLVTALQKAFTTEDSVKKFNEMLSSRLELDKLAMEALKNLLNVMRANAGAIIIEKDGELQLLSSSGIIAPEKLIDNQTIGHVFADKKRRCFEFPSDIQISGLLLDFHPKHIIAEPILYKGIVLGVIVLAGDHQFYSDGAMDIELYSQGLSLALKNAVTHDQLQKLAANDPLTGILNRRFGLLRLQEEFSRAIRTSQPLGVLMIDIDHFKNVNDTYGHLLGDKVLINMTETAKKALREGDIFLRYGGEEFAVILPGASPVDAQKIAEGIRRSIEEASFIYNSQHIKITVSIGGTSFPNNNVGNFNNLIEAADKNLYRAKENGRNLAVVE
ncbi:MAG: sensor domain-containing diguanylate cyclase [Erysipelotrichia bacterium]|nr:sensor domain-containing diguanylate cyclase [Erysipelotrichia bacterium]